MIAFDPAGLDLPACHHIGGVRVEAEAAIAVQAPSDGRGLRDIPCGDAETVNRAVTAAREALARSGWADCAPRDRLRALTRWADLIEAEAETLARLEAVASSRPASQVQAGDIPVTAEQIRFFAEFADKVGGTVAPTSAGQLGFIADAPHGIVGAVTPWNFPVSMAGWKMGPALAAGNAVVLKPSEMTPYSAVFMADLAVQAGVPEGLINIVQGDGPTTGAALVAHSGVDKVSFTGSTRAGGQIMETIARSGIKPMTLELGGKSPVIVFADADLDLVADCIDRGIMFNAGQVCVAGSRVIVDAAVADELTAKLLARFARHVPAETWAEASGFSPVISTGQLSRIDGIVTAARNGGAEVLCGGERFDRPGSFYRPTLLAPRAADSPALTEEIFGPVATLQTFTNEDEALALAAHPTYGLASGVFTRDLSRALRVTRAIEAGTVWVNRYGRSRDHILPTGGWKASGVGKDLGREAYLANRRTKSVLIDL